ncbi:MAG TPA: hypothetical protein VJ777_12690 [Mycobacterium sp.]|nr:hypothetical protein [Mycobacterium sp.]
MSTYNPAHRRACCAAITALGNRIGLYAGTTRVGTVFGDTTWATPTDVNEPVDPSKPFNATTNPNIDKAASTGSTVTISVPGATVANGTVIDGYGIFNGSTLLRTQALSVTLTVSDGSQSLQIDVTPTFKFWGV